MKIKSKFMIIFSMVLFVILTCNANSVIAVDDETIQNIMNKIPNTIDMEVATKNNWRPSESIVSKINQYIREDIEQYNLNTYAYFRNSNGDNLTDARDIVFYINGKYKYIRLNYTDENWNDSDRNIIFNQIKDLDLDIETPDIDIDETRLTFTEEEWIDYYTSLYSQKLEELNLEYKVYPTHGDYIWCYNDSRMGCTISFSKNGVVYYTYNTVIYANPIIIIPSNIWGNDDAVIQYCKNKVKEYVDDEYDPDANITISKGNNENEYIVENYNTIFKIVKEADKNVEDTDDTTNIKLESDTSVIPANTILDCEKITNNSTINNIKTIIAVDEEKFVAYEITLKSNGVEIQPDGSVKISIPIPDTFDKSKLAIYRIGDNGEKIKYNYTINGNYAVINADHFSTYVIADLTTEQNSSSNTENDTVKSDNTTTSEESNEYEKKENAQETNTKKSNNPKTGDMVVTYFIILVIAGTIVVFINKNKSRKITKH